MPTFAIYHKCNNKCIMCTNKNKKKCQDINKKYSSLSYFFERIKRFYNGKNEFIDDYHDSFSLTGGEPTLNPDLISILNKINELFPRIRINLLTNGRMFSYEHYSKAILNLNINLELCISIHSHTADIHDKITQTKNSFKQTIKGIENILRFKKTTQILEIRIVIHQLNYKNLEQIVRFIRHNFPQINRLVFIFFEIEGRAINNLGMLRLTFKQLYPYLTKIYPLINYFSEVRLYHFPLCTIPIELLPYAWRTLPDSEISFPKNCIKCNIKKYCLGVHREYLKYVGSDEFRPIKYNIDIKNCNDWHHPILGITP